MKVPFVHIALALLLPLLFGNDGCAEVDLPQGIEAAGYAFVDQNDGVNLSALFRQDLYARDTTERMVSGLSRYSAGCSQFSSRQWETISPDLVEIHNALVDPAGEPLPAKTIWIAPIAEDPRSGVQIVLRHRRGVSSVGINTRQPLWTLDAEAAVDLQSDEYSLLLVDVTHKVELSLTAEDCVRKTICLASEHFGGRYTAGVAYGSLIALNIDAARIGSSARIEAGVPTKGGRLSLSLDRRDFQVDGYIIGKIAASDAGAAYDIPEIARDLQERRLLRVMHQLSEQTRRRNIIGVYNAEVTAADCRRLFPDRVRVGRD